MSKQIIFQDKNALNIITQVLNEVCYGLDLGDFKAKIGGALAEVKALLNKIEEGAQDLNRIELESYEITWLIHSFKEVFKNIEDWEFETRMGFSLQEAKETLSMLEE